MSEAEVAKHLSLVDGLSNATASKGKLDLLHKFARLYQHPLLLDGDGDDSTVDELKATSSKLREVLHVLHGIRQQREKAIVFARHKDMQRVLARVFAEESYPEVALLKQVKGVGTLIALTYVLTLEDPRRFRKSRDAGCYVGLQNTLVVPLFDSWLARSYHSPSLI